MAQAKIRIHCGTKARPWKTQFSTFVFNEITGFKISKNLDRVTSGTSRARIPLTSGTNILG